MRPRARLDPTGVVAADGAMRVIVDRGLCEGNAVCANVAPEVFVVGDDDLARVQMEPIDEVLRAKVDLAVRRCPRQALTLVD